MPNVATVLKSEISRVARKEVKSGITPLRKAVSTYRTEIAALKRRTQAVEQLLRRLANGHMKEAPGADVEQVPERFRFSAKGLASQRQRLGLSAEQCGRLLGASSQSVYNWEQGKTRPLARHLPAIAALRGLSRKDATARLQSLPQ
jgi:DNA-binding transcriptional regulator YiaG